jgi:leucyl aminopeptidase
MTIPAPEFLPTLDDVAADDLVVIGLRKHTEGPQIFSHALSESVSALLADAAVAIGAEGGMDSTWRVPAPAGLSAKGVVLVGMGEEAPTADTLRAVAGFAAQSVKKPERLVFAFAHENATEHEAILEGAILGSYRTDKVTADKKDTTPRIALVGELTEESVSRIVTQCEAVFTVRNLVTTPPNMLNPVSFVTEVEKLAKDTTLSIEILDEKELEKQGFGGITAVGKGSINPPRLMILRHQPADPSRHVALVGKGITFDSGGLSLKPPTAMVGMKYDMTGAAVMAATTIAAAQLGSPAAITTYLCLAENMPSGTASRPNDVITIKGGKTVEILNTDAEGRLVMADGLQAASALNPDLIVDAATLTGAARIALGERYAGLMGSTEATAQIQAAAAEAGELVWPMPLPPELRTILNSDVADIANVKPGEVLGGMLSAGQFLKDFVGTNDEGEDIPWAHLDIAGPAANSSGPYGYTPKGPTGAITRTLISLVMSGNTPGSKPAGQ